MELERWMLEEKNVMYLFQNPINGSLSPDLLLTLLVYRVRFARNTLLIGKKSIDSP